MIEQDWLLKLKYCLIINPSLMFQFLLAANLFRMSIDLHVQHPELSILLTTMHIKIWRLIPLVMEKWFYCQYGTSTCRMVNCFHLMNAFTDRINVLKFIFWQMYHIKWNCQLEYHSQFMLICHMFWVKTLT